jgi:hypothetical protein
MEIDVEQLINQSEKLYPVYKSQSTGTNGYTRINPFAPKLLGTTGAVEMAKELEANWFFDIVASYMKQITKHSSENEEHFYAVRILKQPDNKAIFLIDDGNYKQVIRQDIEYTDLKMNLKCYLQTDGEHWVLMMPSEY